MSSCDLGLIGLAVMGENLAKNFAGNQFSVAVYNRTSDVTSKFIMNNQHLRDRLVACYDIKEFIRKLKSPRKIVIMVKAGEAVDKVINELLPGLSSGDIIIDGGNSYYKDTQRRFKYLNELSIHFVGMGVSGGEKGALLGPSLMPGGDKEVVANLLPILKKIAAKKPEPCVYYMGNDGAGHFVKMVHNGIEYAEMQIIAEVYDIFRKIFGFDNTRIADIFQEFQKTDLNSYLLEITIKILKRLDGDTKHYLVDLISDESEGKGTGKWTIMESLDYGIPVPSIYGALSARNISSDRIIREKISDLYPQRRSKRMIPENLLSIIEQSMLASKIISYGQGFNLIAEASKVNGWQTSIVDVVKSWRDGCIIRSVLLDRMIDSLKENSNLLLTGEFVAILKDVIIPLKQTLFLALESEVATPSMSGACWYFEYFREILMPTNLIQAQRDYFGAHTYKRIDKTGVFHTSWE